MSARNSPSRTFKARDEIYKLSEEDVEFADPKLDGKIKQWAKELETAYNKKKNRSDTEKTMLFALKSYGVTLLNTRNAILAAYSKEAKGRVEYCVKIEEGMNTITLKISPKKSWPYSIF